MAIFIKWNVCLFRGKVVQIVLYLPLQNIFPLIYRGSRFSPCKVPIVCVRVRPTSGGAGNNRCWERPNIGVSRVNYGGASPNTGGARPNGVVVRDNYCGSPENVGSARGGAGGPRRNRVPQLDSVHTKRQEGYVPFRSVNAPARNHLCKQWVMAIKSVQRSCEWRDRANTF